jgi:hypothetical protein
MAEADVEALPPPATRKLTRKAWREMAAELADVIDESSTLDEYLSAVENTPDTNRVALFDRNTWDCPWRPVVLELVERGAGLEDSTWRLLDVDGVTVLDEPDAACPASGFTEKVLVDDVIAGYYRVASEEESEVSEVAEAETAEVLDGDADSSGDLSNPNPNPDADADTNDLDMRRVWYEGQMGTLRTREGSKDACIPANKVLFLSDQGQGKHSLVRVDDVASVTSVVKGDDDTKPLGLRPVQLLRGSRGSKADGTYLGELEVPLAVPEKHTEFKAFTGVHFVGRDRAILSGENVHAMACVSDERPNNEFYFVCALKAKVGQQVRLNALVYCAEDDTIEQLALVHVRQASAPIRASDTVLERMKAACEKYTLKNFATVYNLSSRAEARAAKPAPAQPKQSRPKPAQPKPAQPKPVRSKPVRSKQDGGKRQREDEEDEEEHTATAKLVRELQEAREAARCAHAEAVAAQAAAAAVPTLPEGHAVLTSLAKLPEVISKLQGQVEDLSSRMTVFEAQRTSEARPTSESLSVTNPITPVTDSSHQFLPANTRAERRVEPLRNELAMLTASVREDERAKRERLAQLQMLM